MLNVSFVHRICNIADSIDFGKGTLDDILPSNVTQERSATGLPYWVWPTKMIPINYHKDLWFGVSQMRCLL